MEGTTHLINAHMRSIGTVTIELSLSLLKIIKGGAHGGFDAIINDILKDIEVFNRDDCSLEEFIYGFTIVRQKLEVMRLISSGVFKSSNSTKRRLITFTYMIEMHDRTIESLKFFRSLL